MKKNLLLLVLVISVSISCTTSSKITKINDPKERFNYPLVIESTTSFEKAWTKLIDVIAVRGYKISHLDKENGLFIGYLTNVPYTFDSNSGQNSDTSAILVLPRLRHQQLRGNNVEASRIVFPDTVSIAFNVRIRPGSKEGVFINVNVPEIIVRGGHYNQKKVSASLKSDTTLISVPLAVKASDWSSAKSTGKLERTIITAIKDGQVQKY